MPIVGKQAFGLQVKLRTSVGAAAVKASRTMGTSNSQIVVTAKVAGTSGNSISIALVNPGSLGSLSVGVVGSTITVTLAHNGSAVTSTANQVIIALYNNAAASALIDASTGAGDGTGVVVAASNAALSGGTNSTSVYSLIEGVGDIDVPGLARTQIEYTNHSSANGYAEYVKSIVKEGRSLTLPLTFDPTNSVHIALKAEEASDNASRMQFIFPFGSQFNFESDVLVLNMPISNQVKGIMNTSVELLLTGAPVLI